MIRLLLDVKFSNVLKLATDVNQRRRKQFSIGPTSKWANPERPKDEAKPEGPKDEA